jgi:para-nitrobenzyl esterase
MDAPDLTPASQALADRIVATWAAFIRGKPLGRGWSAAKVMRFEPGAVRPLDLWSEYQCDFWRAEYPAFFGTPAKEPQ